MAMPPALASAIEEEATSDTRLRAKKRSATEAMDAGSLMVPWLRNKGRRTERNVEE
jgi:hypothetical protein